MVILVSGEEKNLPDCAVRAFLSGTEIAQADHFIKFRS